MLTDDWDMHELGGNLDEATVGYILALGALAMERLAEEQDVDVRDVLAGLGILDELAGTTKKPELPRTFYPTFLPT